MVKIKILIIAIFGLRAFSAMAQPDFMYLKKTSYLEIGGGTVKPGTGLSGTNGDGLFAKNGGQFYMNYDYFFGYGIGLGANLEADFMGFDQDKFLSYSGAESMSIKGGYSSTKFGLNLLGSLPIILIQKVLALHIYAEGNAGFRGFSIPDINLYYDELSNKYVEVDYHPRSSSMYYLGYGGGVQLMYKKKFGLNVSYNKLLPIRNSIYYSVRMTDAFDEVTEKEGYLNNYLDCSGIRFGIMFIFGGKKPSSIKSQK
jgi:hypothetical protein